MFDHEKLRVYRDALEFVAWSEALLDKIPGKLAVKDQLDRASTSIPLNIAEGNGRSAAKDRSRSTSKSKSTSRSKSTREIQY
ncbi:MAG: four helix bundle protein [Planctomycetota bacterium]|nr:four helix bundle protein [Planctomycetota bacterium]